MVVFCHLASKSLYFASLCFAFFSHCGYCRLAALVFTVLVAVLFLIFSFSPPFLLPRHFHRHFLPRHSLRHFCCCRFLLARHSRSHTLNVAILVIFTASFSSFSLRHSHHFHFIVIVVIFTAQFSIFDLDFSRFSAHRYIVAWSCSFCSSASLLGLSSYNLGIAIDSQWIFLNL